MAAIIADYCDPRESLRVCDCLGASTVIIYTYSTDGEQHLLAPIESPSLIWKTDRLVTERSLFGNSMAVFRIIYSF